MVESLLESEDEFGSGGLAHGFRGSHLIGTVTLTQHVPQSNSGLLVDPCAVQPVLVDDGQRSGDRVISSHPRALEQRVRRDCYVGLRRLHIVGTE